MKRYFLLTMGFLLGITPFLTTTQAQSVQTTNVIVVYNNAQSNDLFQDVSRFYFNNDNLVIDQHGEETNLSLSIIRRLELDAITTDVESWDDNTILLYPNPTSDHLYFSTSQNRNVQVAIYALSGQQLYLGQVNTAESIDVSYLSKGIYIIKIDEQVHKFTKL